MDKPRVGDQLHQAPPRSRVAGALTHSARLRDALTEMYSMGEDAAFRYERAVESLNREPEETMVAIVAAYGHSREGDYAQRHALVHAAGAVAHPSALAFLGSVALSEIPAEAAPDPHSFSTVAEETIIRMSAVDAIGRHASRGDARAADLLLRCVENSAFSVRRAAVTHLLAHPEAQRFRARLEALVPKNQHFIFELKHVSVREAVQVRDPTLHLRDRYQASDHQKPRIGGDHVRDKPATK